MASLRTETLTCGVFRVDHSEYLEPPTRRNTQAVWLPHATRGQGETILKALGTLMMRLDYWDELLVLNCDQGFAPGVLDELVARGRHARMSAALTFKAPREEEHRWSFVDDFPIFHDAEEKRYIGENALAGAYYFPDYRDLHRSLISVVHWADISKTEPYLSHAYGFISKKKLAVDMRREDWYDWGTPDSFERFLSEYSESP